jgi:hypothetical protein
MKDKPISDLRRRMLEDMAVRRLGEKTLVSCSTSQTGESAYDCRHRPNVQWVDLRSAIRFSRKNRALVTISPTNTRSSGRGNGSRVKAKAKIRDNHSAG